MRLVSGALGLIALAIVVLIPCAIVRNANLAGCGRGNDARVESNRRALEHRIQTQVGAENARRVGNHAGARRLARLRFATIPLTDCGASIPLVPLSEPATVYQPLAKTAHLWALPPGRPAH